MNFNDLLFDTPWWIPGALAMVGIVLLLTGNRRQEKPLMLTGGVFLLLAVGWGLMSYLVDTDLEKAVKRTRNIAAAVDQRNWARLKSLLEPNTQFAFYSNREDIVNGGQLTAEKIGLKNVRLTGVDARQTDTLITVDVNALSEQDIGPALPTSWRFNYSNLGSGFQLTSIEVLPNRVIGPEVVQNYLSAPRKQP